jgi:hypothetical protein
MGARDGPPAAAAASEPPVTNATAPVAPAASRSVINSQKLAVRPEAPTTRAVASMLIANARLTPQCAAIAATARAPSR